MPRMKKQPSYFAVRRLMARALANGAIRHSLNHCEWDIAGKCLFPYHKEIHAHPPTVTGEVRVDRSTRTPFRVELWVRCHRCDMCLLARQYAWTAKAIFECQNSIRTWFGTLTLAPEHQHLVYAQACQDYASSGDFDALGMDVQFAKRCKVINVELTKYIKRMRRVANAPLRILFVAEHHKSGLPHYHGLIHERSATSALTYDNIGASWTWGFTKWKLLTDPKQATYVCKYLSKSKATRIRGSLHYGKSSLDIANAFGESVKTNDPTPFQIPLSEERTL